MADLFITNTISDLMRDSGVRILKYDLYYPVFNEETPFSSVNSFCCNFTNAYCEWLRDELFKRLCAEYAADSNPRKRFYNNCTDVGFDFTVTYANIDSGILSMYWDIYRRKSGVVNSFVRKSNTWDTVNGFIHSARDFSHKHNKKYNNFDFYLRDNMLILYENMFIKSIKSDEPTSNYSFLIHETPVYIKKLV